jgi:hypothetical protein
VDDLAHHVAVFARDGVWARKRIASMICFGLMEIEGEEVRAARENAEEQRKKHDDT